MGMGRGMSSASSGMSICLSHYIRCTCLDGKVRGKRHRDCDGWGVLLEELPPRPQRGQMGLLGVETCSGVPRELVAEG